MDLFPLKHPPYNKIIHLPTPTPVVNSGGRFTFSDKNEQFLSENNHLYSGGILQYRLWRCYCNVKQELVNVQRTKGVACK